MLQPKFGMLGTVVEAVQEQKIKDAVIIPISISYEKVLEGDTYPYELMGEEKIKESLLRLVKASKILGLNFGKINIVPSTPFSIKKFIAQNNKLKKNELLSTLGYRITHELQDNLVIMPTYMVASIMLMHRKGIMENVLISKVEWLTAEILKRGKRVSGFNEHTGAQISVRNSIKLLNELFIITKKTVFQLSIAPCLKFKSILMLNYYRNGLIHVLYLEAICACALFSFGHQAAVNDGVSLD